MKTIIATAVLFFMAGVCVAGVQPTQTRGKLSMTDLLTYNNFNCQKASKNNAPKVYAAQQETMQNPTSSQPVPHNASLGQTFTPTPLVNFYKEFR